MSLSTNRLKDLWQRGNTAFGAWCAMPTSLSAEMLSKDNVDYVGIDCQHGLIEHSLLLPMLQAISTSQATPVVRVPSNDSAWIGKALDSGAEVVIVPMVESRSEAQRAVEACRYSPAGGRSYGPIRSRMYLGADPDAVNRQVVCLAMAETQRAVLDIDEICSTPGLDGIYVGPADLAISMGLPNLGQGSSEHAAAIERIRVACERNGIVVGIHASGGDQARSYAELGFRMITVATDVTLLRTALRDQMSLARHKPN
jgi:4-hydroxy-2-oxoheptanedioate aldolase